MGLLELATRLKKQSLLAAMLAPANLTTKSTMRMQMTMMAWVASPKPAKAAWPAATLVHRQAMHQQHAKSALLLPKLWAVADKLLRRQRPPRMVPQQQQTTSLVAQRTRLLTVPTATSTTTSC